jgi:hypothetical protein
VVVSVESTLDVFAALLVLGLVALGALAVRRRMLTRRGGTFDCSLRTSRGPHGKGWTLGIGRYAGDIVEWYRVFSYSPRPKRIFRRRDLEIIDRRAPQGQETFALLSGAVIVRCRDGVASGNGDDDPTVELAMGNGALTGFLSWIESAPPGQAR